MRLLTTSRAYEELWRNVKAMLRRRMSEVKLNAIVKDVTGRKLKEALEKI